MLLRMDFAGGHGMVGGTMAQQREELVDFYAFLAAELGLAGP